MSKYHLDEWIETIIYNWFEERSQKRLLPTAAEAAQIAPFLQMYQAIQTRQLNGEMDMLWHLLYEGRADIGVHTREPLDMNIVGLPTEEQANKRK